MLPTVLELRDEYLPELLDPLHREIGTSTPLYQEWVALQEDNEDIQSFAEWILATNNETDKNEQVLYLDDDALEKCRVYFSNGLAERNITTLNFSAKGLELNTIREKISCNSAFRQARVPLALVIRADDLMLYAIDKLVKNLTSFRQNHTTLTAGTPVLFAAEAFLRDGQYTSISDNSGHYKPKLNVFMYGIEQMITAGADLSKTRFGITREVTQFEYSNGTEFIDLYLNHGFNSPNFQGSFSNQDEIEQHFASSKIDNAVYFDVESNELYEITRYELKHIVITYKNKYDDRIAELDALRNSAAAAANDDPDRNRFMLMLSSPPRRKAPPRFLREDSPRSENESDSSRPRKRLR
jgi:hypothetical protein